jgi:nicotinamidase-related amidase
MRGGAPSPGWKDELMTQEPFVVEAGRTAVVIMDFQVGIVGPYARDPEGTVQRAASVLAAARSAGIPVIHVVHRGGQFAAESPDISIHPGVAPAEDELVLTKVRAGSFSTTALDVLLREQGRDTLVLMGVATSGCVLSTVRWGADLSYRLVVVKDACDDRDEEVHRVLTEKIYPRQATVVTAAEFAVAAAR